MKIIFWLTGIALAAWMLGEIMDSINVPVMYMSYPDMECVAIEGGHSDENCDNTPSRFEVIYVDPRWKK